MLVWSQEEEKIREMNKLLSALFQDQAEMEEEGKKYQEEQKKLADAVAEVNKAVENTKNELE